MFMIKALITLVFAIVVITSLVQNTNKWADQLRQYMIKESEKNFGSSVAWSRPWTRFFARILIVFFGLVGIIFVYAIIFSYL